MSDICKIDWDVEVRSVTGMTTPFDVLQESKDTDRVINIWYTELIDCNDEDYEKMMRLSLHALEALEQLNSFVDGLEDGRYKEVKEV